MKKLLLSLIILASGLVAFSQQRAVHNKTAGEKLNEQYCSGLFRAAEATYFDMLNGNEALGAIGYTNILDWLQGRVAGLQIYTTRNNDRIPFIRNSRAGIYIDEVLRDPGALASLPVTDIAMIKIIKGPFAGGFNSPGGVIAIYTVGTDDEEDETGD